MVACAILSNFYEEQCTQNLPQYLSGLSRARFPSTFLEMAVHRHVHITDKKMLFMLLYIVLTVYLLIG